MARRIGQITFVQRKSRYHWMVESPNGQVIAMSPPRGYSRATDARRGAKRTRHVLNERAF